MREKTHFEERVLEKKILARKNLPLRHDLERIGQITVDVLHLKGVSVADLVVCPAVIGTLDHDDITSWTA